jgi:thioredoxin reductase
MDNELDSAYDVVVIGGGAAGLAGALTLGRSRRTVLVVDSGEPRNAPAGHVHNYLTSEGMPPGELLAVGRDEVAQYGVRFVSCVVTGVRQRSDDYRFQVDLANGDSVRARRLLVASGLVDELPEIPGVARRWGRDVLHCPYCHGWEVRDQAIGVLATGPMAVHSALLFRQLSDDVIVFRHTTPALPAEQAEQLAARGIAVIDGEVSALEISDDRLAGVRLRSGEFVARQAVVVTPRCIARAELLAEVGLTTVDFTMAGHVLASYLPADPTGATDVPGVWAAGNIVDPTAQVIGSAAAGLKAGAAINADLVSEDTDRAVAARVGDPGRLAPTL